MFRFDVPSVSGALKHAVSQRLTLSWADTTKTLRFRAREAVLFDGQLEDGQYRWELTALPRAKTTSIASRMSQSVMDDAKRDALERQQIKDSPIHAFQRSASGVFTVAQGQVISSLIQEPQSRQNPHSHARKVKTNETQTLQYHDCHRHPHCNDRSDHDQLIQDDLIANSSLCVGVDCANGEAFSFDTIRLKENNVRIKFQDTSRSASFPSTDWELQSQRFDGQGRELLWDHQC